MAIPKFYTKYNIDELKRDHEACDQTLVTQASGYLQPKEQIEGMILAGKTLEQYREMAYSSDGLPPDTKDADIPLSPINRGSDIVDINNAQREHLKERKEVIKKMEEAKKAAAAQSQSGQQQQSSGQQQQSSGQQQQSSGQQQQSSGQNNAS